MRGGEKFMKYKKFLALVISFLALSLNKSFAADRAILVTQPAYHYMSFHVYKPAKLPIDIYSTFDGYLVYKNKNIWYYASYNKGTITKTGYVVGSVIPQVVKLKPYNARISSVAPILGNESENQDQPRIIYTPPSSKPEGEGNIYLPSNADWTRNEIFMSIGKWQGSVNKIGVLSRPKIPVAWKGDYPEVIYAWTGGKWKQIFPRSKFSSAISTLRRELYNLTIESRKSNLFYWSDEDTNILARYSSAWAYEWLGVINLGE